MSSPPIKVGLIGYGLSTTCFHLPYLLPHPDLRVHAILQRAAVPIDDEALKKLRWGHCTIDFPQAKHYRTADEFFADGEIELVVVCTHSHEEFVERALRAGMHVVVEKPFVTSSREADRLIKLAEEKGRILTVYQNRRFDSNMRTLQHLIENGALGDVRDAQLHYDFPSPSWIEGWTERKYTPGQGMMWGLGSHTIDQALVLFGTPATVTGFLSSNRGVDSEVDDTFTIILTYDPKGERKNLLVTIKTAVVTHMKDQLKLFVRGTEGTFLKFGLDPQEARAIANPAQPALDPDFGKEDEGIWGELTTKEKFEGASQTLDEESGLWIGKFPSVDGWGRGYYENVVDAVRGRAEVGVKPETARDGARVIELARESWETGRRMAFGYD